MRDVVQENLLGLLLGALEDDERRELEEQLETDPLLRAEFARLREALEPLDQARVNYEPAWGLADRTFAHVQRETALRELQAKTPPKLSPSPEPMSRRSSWSVRDLVVCVSAIGAALTLILPALFSSWEMSRRVACQNNLRQIGYALHDFAAQSPNQRLPEIPQEGNRSFAGVYAPMLFEAGYISNPNVFLCASSDLSRSGIIWKLPTLDDIDNTGNASLVRIQRIAGGSFGYNLGFFSGDEYFSPTVDNQNPSYVWAADAPTWNLAGRNSVNHLGKGQNMLFADQRTAFVVGSLVPPSGDDVFRNDRGLIAPGIDRYDSVVADSQARPFLRNASLP